MKDKLVIKDLEKVKIISDAFRLKILKVLQEKKKASSTEVANELDESPSKISYHIKLLKEHGFVELAETEVKGNLVEKYYSPVAKKIKIKLDDAEDIESDIKNKHETNKLLNNTLAMIGEDLQNKTINDNSSISYMKYHLTEKEVTEIEEVVSSKLEELEERKSKEKRKLDDECLEYKVGLLLLNTDEEKKGEE